MTYVLEEGDHLPVWDEYVLLDHYDPVFTNPGTTPPLRISWLLEILLNTEIL